MLPCFHGSMGFFALLVLVLSSSASKYFAWCVTVWGSVVCSNHCLDLISFYDTSIIPIGLSIGFNARYSITWLHFLC